MGAAEYGAGIDIKAGRISELSPKTGQVVQVPPKRVPFFKVGKELKEMVDYPEGRDAAKK